MLFRIDPEQLKGGRNNGDVLMLASSGVLPDADIERAVIHLASSPDFLICARSILRYDF